MSYLLIEPDGTKHQLNFENIADIQTAIENVHEMLDIISRNIDACKGRILEKNIPKVAGEVFEVAYSMPSKGCLSETVSKMSKVSIPETPY